MLLIIFDVNYFNADYQLIKDYQFASRSNEIVKMIQFFRMFALKAAFDCTVNNHETQQLFMEYQTVKLL